MKERFVIHRFGLTTFLFILFAMTASLILSGCDSYNAWKTYGKAENALEQKDYELAFNLLESIPDRMDKKELRPKAAYEYAKKLARIKKYDQAVELFERYPDYEDSKTRIHDTYMELAQKYSDLGEFGNALAIYKKIGEENKVLTAMIENADGLINEGKYEAGMEALSGVEGNEQAAELLKAAKMGSLYLQGMAAIGVNDMGTVRKRFDEAVKIKSEKQLRKEDEYIDQFCTAIKPLAIRWGSENNYEEVLRALYPVHHKFRIRKTGDCPNLVKLLQAVEDKYYFSQTSKSDWHQNLEKYREKFQDPSALCNVYGGLIEFYLRKGRRLSNALEATEQVGAGCEGQVAVQWDNAKKTLEIALTTKLLDWKREKDFKKIILLQKYITANLAGITLDLGTWGQFQEEDLKPESKFGNTRISGNKFMVNGFVSNPSSYRPLHLKAIILDCENSETHEVKTQCVTSNVVEKVMPKNQRTLTARVTLPAGYDAIVAVNLESEFEKETVNKVKAKDLFD